MVFPVVEDDPPRTREIAPFPAAKPRWVSLSAKWHARPILGRTVVLNIVDIDPDIHYIPVHRRLLIAYVADQPVEVSINTIRKTSAINPTGGLS
jgi:hypothetical protein